MKDRRVKVQIPKDKVRQAIELAEARNAKQKRFGAMTYGGKRGSLEAHLLGILPEMAAAHYFGVDVDRRIFLMSGDDGEDLVLPDLGVTQIKTTTYWSYPWLRAELEHDHDGIQTYMLAYCDDNDHENVWLIGWLPRSEVVTKPQRRLRQDGGPMNYIVTEEELRPIPATRYLTERYLLSAKRNNTTEMELIAKMIAHDKGIDKMKDIHVSIMRYLRGIGKVNNGFSEC